MLDAENPADTTAAAPTDASSAPADTAPSAPAKKTPAKKAAAKKAPAKKAAAKKAPAKKTATKKTAAAAADTPPDAPVEASAEAPVDAPVALAAEAAAPAKKAAKKAPAKKAAAKKTTAKKAASTADAEQTVTTADAEQAVAAPADAGTPTASPIMPMFQAPDPAKAVQPRKRVAKKQAAPVEAPVEAPADPGVDAVVEDAPVARKRAARPAKKQADRSVEDTEAPVTVAADEDDQAPGDLHEGPADDDTEDDEQGGTRRRRRRGGRRRRKSNGSDDNGESGAESDAGSEDAAGQSDDNHGPDDAEHADGATGRRRRRRRRTGEDGESSADDPQHTVTRVRRTRHAEDEITSLHGSTRLEAKKQRRREGREAGRRRAPIVSEAEFLARREAVDRVMVIRQKKDLTQIAVLEDKVLVEHYVARESQTSLIGNVYLGRVQNVLPSMEAAFVDIGKGRNAVLYAGEVNWDSLGAKHGGQRKIEQVLKSGQSILVQVSKDPIGHKGARLTSQISLPGRFLVYVPDGTTSGISRKLPDTERTRLKTLLKEIVPGGAGVIVRTAAEGASEEELRRDVERLTARWENIAGKVEGGNAPQLLYGEPDLTLKVVRDLFTEDFAKLVVSGDEAWDMVDEYVKHLAPDLEDRLERYDGANGRDVFAEYRIDEQIGKGLDRKVWLPSGGSLVIDRTEAMTVVDVNTGKFTGSGGNLEETVTKNNLEAAEEIVRQLRLRDIGGIIVVDFIDMVLESNRDLVMRRMVECLGRDRTRHQVAEVTSLGLIQMTRKRIGTGLLEAFSETCEHCQGRGLLVHHEPVESRKKQDEEPRRARRTGRGRGEAADSVSTAIPSPRDVAAIAKPDSRPIVTDDADTPAEPVARATDDTAAHDVPEEATQGRSQSRSRGRGGRSRQDHQDTPPVQLAPEAPATVAEPVAEPVAAPAPEPVAPAAAVAADTKPATTSRRRRSASRPAGPPVEPGAKADEAAAEPVVIVAPAPAVVAVPETAAPKIVTSVRRRGASRPAGPPTSAPDGGPADDVAAAVAVDGEEQAPHVPVKKKGSRKR